MAIIDMQAILVEAQKYMNSTEGQNLIREKVDEIMLGNITFKASSSIHTPEEAADKFIEVLYKEIESSGLSADAVEALSGIDHGSVYSLSNGTYQISVFFAGDRSRPSLEPSRFGGIDYIEELLNYGIKDGHKMRPVHGKWHGKETWSRTVIPGTYFMENARASFLSNYASEYNVVDIVINQEHQ